MTRQAVSPVRVSLSGMLLLALAMGIGRFAFTPLLPLMSREGLLRATDGAWLASANYLGYLAGALWMSWRPCALVRTMRSCALGTLLTTGGMGVAHSLEYWTTLRFASGVFSAGALVATSAWTLEQLEGIKRMALAGGVYAGVGVGIFAAGSICLLLARYGVSSSHVWLTLSALGAAAVIGFEMLFPRSVPNLGATSHQKEPSSAHPSSSALLVLSYGMAGFGYIIPATFLPEIARGLVGSTNAFGFAWPLFGLAAVGSTIWASTMLTRIDRVTLWVMCSAAMGTGAMLPVLFPTLKGVLIAALLVGGTFIIVTMAGLQEARARASSSPVRLLGSMTSAFALGQFLGPALAAVLISHRIPLPMNKSLEASAIALFGSVAILGLDKARQRCRQPDGQRN